ncbi:hypothetical protein F5B17DRAFT_443008 [Nemania serpens]|nr:hypothetical protein F5B17DRAFT_443008 [Nemania serpens]
MPRKVRLPASPAQNRENQQRSRARRREHLASLEARVRDYEQREVRASVEMQRAAREVAWVNERLVELLAARGVTRGEVDEFLRRRKEERDRGGAFEDYARSANQDPESFQRSRGGVTRAVLVAGAEASDPAIVASEGVSKGIGDARGRGRVSGSGIEGRDIDTDTSTSTEGSRALLTSCDDAANIIAQLQGHGDVLHARETLGCGDSPNCHIKNTRLFQLMDET